MHAAAFVVGPQDGAGGQLTALAREAGLDPVLPYGGLARAEAQVAETPLVLFLCAAVADVRTLKPMADAIRFSPARKMRFSPLMYFAHDPSFDSIKRCINMGFDDVIALPCSKRALAERISRQVGPLCIYYETTSYFGPDRRDRLESDLGDPRRGSGGQFRRLEIVRSVEHGVDVVRDDLQVEL